MVYPFLNIFFERNHWSAFDLCRFVISVDPTFICYQLDLMVIYNRHSILHYILIANQPWIYVDQSKLIFIDYYHRWFLSLDSEGVGLRTFIITVVPRYNAPRYNADLAITRFLLPKFFLPHLLRKWKFLAKLANISLEF